MHNLFKWLGLLAVLYAAGFGLFISLLPAQFSGHPSVDGIVVFTGGTNRVPSVISFLRNGYGGPVLISGVHPDVRKNELAGEPPLPDDVLARMTLDVGAQNTKGNVRNTRVWAENLGLVAANGKTVGIVTSTYHVPRVRLLALLHARHLNIFYLPVQPDAAGLRDLWREYNKLIFWWAVN